jgi:two-component system response regulator HydG
MDTEARLVAVSGASQGRTHTLPEGDVSIGRDESNQIVVNEPSVARWHCLISRAGAEVKITDLGSFNGTVVNGVPVNVASLAHGDQIAVGGTLFQFLLGGAEADPSVSAVQLEEEELTAGATIRLQKESALFLRTEEALQSLPAAARIARDFNVLLKISTAINSIRGPRELQLRLLELIFEVMPADRGAIVLFGSSPEEIVSLIGRERHARGDREFRVSQTVIKQVTRSGDAILVNDVPDNSELSKAESLRLPRISSLLCAPLTFFGDVIGAIYLDTRNEAVKFDEGHLELVAGVAGVAAVALENALHLEWLENENEQLLEAGQVKHQIIGDSGPMRKIYQLIGQIAPTDSVVLIRGESGTGKELAAHALHLNSLRFEGPFIAVNCAAFAELLFENEFFGHEKGAFSGADARKKGLLEAAHEGTLFLDEVGDLTASAQAKLLRVIETKEFRRVGGTDLVAVDIRVVAATNKDLEQAVEQHTFREDLYHRLNVITFEMPPLRARGDDTLLLAGYFVRKYNQKYKRNITGISREARARLMSYAWPGNVRELKNVIERAVIMGQGSVLTAQFLPQIFREESPDDQPTLNMHEAMKEAQRQVIVNAFRRANCNYNETAKIVGVHPTHLHRIIRILNLKPELIQLKSQRGYVSKTPGV